MRLPAQRDAPAAGASGRQPAHSEPSGDSCGSPAVGGHLSQDLVGRLEGCRQLARCCQDQPSPQVFKPFCSFAISFLLPRFGAVNFFFFPSAALLWFLADKASFSPDLKSRVFQAPGGIHAATDRAGRRTAATFTDCGQGQQGRQLLGHGAPWRKQTLTALWREGGLSSK